MISVVRVVKTNGVVFHYGERQGDVVPPPRCITDDGLFCLFKQGFWFN